jgi:hypothetical protein
MGRVKGAGTDCLMMLAEVYEAAGVVPHIEVPSIQRIGTYHRGAERYLDGVMRHAIEISGQPQPDDVVVFRFGCCYAHGAIVVEWPWIIHAGCRWGDLWRRHAAKASQPQTLFSRSIR